MDETGSRLLIIGLIVAGFMLFNHFARQAAKRLQEQREAEERAAAPEETEEELEDIWGRPVPPRPLAPAPGEAAPAPRSVPAAPPPARAAHPLFRTPQDLRRAIVAMTVLGPCRAQEPPEQR